MKVYEMSEAQRRAWDEWLASRPPAVREIARRFPPNVLFRLTTSHHRVLVYSYGVELDGRITMTVLVSGQYNAVMFERRVFGIPPEQLEECDLPAPGEPLGVVLTESADIDEYLDHERARLVGESIESMVRALA